MSKINFSGMARAFRQAFYKHGPDILTWLGIAGMATTPILAVKATPSAMRRIEQKKKELGADKLTPIETVQAAWKCYIPSASTFVVSAACLIGAQSENVRRNAALATAYTISETALMEYQEKVVGEIGEKKEQAIRDSIAKDKLEAAPVVTNKEVIISDSGETMCYDAISGRYFKSSVDKLKKAENELNRELLRDMYVSLNDFYFLVNLSATKMGDSLGWNIDHGLVELDFSAQLLEGQTPCLVLDYRLSPQYDYRKLI